MAATPYALAIGQQVSLAIRQIQLVFDHDVEFDPTTASACFSVRMSDVLGALLLPNMMLRLSRVAPGVSLDILHLPPARTVDALERDEMHVAVSMGLAPTASILSEPLIRDRMVCVVRAGHPIARKNLTVDEFLAQDQVKVSMSPTDRRFVDDVLGDMNRTRRVVLNVPHWLVLPDVLRATDLVAVMPGRLAALFSGRDLTSLELPFASRDFDWSLYWHRRYAGSRSVDWLRGLIRESAAALSS